MTLTEPQTKTELCPGPYMFVSSYLYRCRFLLCASGEAVKVFSTSTEECIHELRGHTGLVTGVLLRPSNHLQVQSPLHLQKRLFSRRLYPETRWYSFNVRKYRKSRIAAEATFSLRVIIYLLSLVQSPSSDQTRIRSLFIFFIYLLTHYPHYSFCWFRPEAK